MSSFFEKFITLYLGTALKIIIAILADRYIAIKLSPELFGNYKYFLTIIAVASSIAGFGFNTGIVQELKKVNTCGLKNSIVVLFSFVVTILISSIFIAILVNTNVQTFIGINRHFEFSVILLGIVGISLNQLLVGVLSVYQNVKVKVLINDILQPVCFIFSLLIYFNLERTLLSAIISYLLSLVLANILNITVVFRKLNLIPSISHWRKINLYPYIKYCTPIFMTNVVVVLALQIDKIVLNMLISEYDLGIYYSVAAMSALIGLILSTLIFIYLPVASGAFNKGKFVQGSMISSFFSKWLMLFSFIPFWLLFNFPGESIVIFYNEEYLGGKNILPILVLGQFINLSAGFTGQNLLALGDSMTQLKIRIFGFLFSLGLTCYLGIIYGECGVAIALLLGLILTNTLQVYMIKRNFNIFIYTRGNLYSVIFILANIVLLKIVNLSLIGLSVAILYPLNIGIYLVMLFKFGATVHDKKALRIIKQLV